MKKTFVRSGLAFIVIVFVTCFSTVFSQAADLQGLARINITQPPDTITLKQLKDRVKMYQQQNPTTVFSVDDKKKILDGLIEERLVLQAAKREGVVVTDSQVDTQFLQSFAAMLQRPDITTEAELQKIVKDSTGMTLNEYMLQEAGMSLSDYKAILKNQITAQNYIIRGKENVMKAAVPTDAEIRKYYDNHRSELTQPETLKLFLVVAAKMNNASAAKSKLAAVFDEVKKGSKDYAGIKRRYDNDAASNIKAGEVYVGRTEQAAQALGMSMDDLSDFFEHQNGYISNIDETAQTFQFFVILDRYQPKMLAISDVVEPESTITVYEAIKARLTQQKQLEVYTRESQDTVKKLRIASNFQMIKDGAELDKLLSSW